MRMRIPWLGSLLVIVFLAPTTVLSESNSKGRNHYLDAGVALFAGAGVKPGRILGATNETGDKIKEANCPPVYSSLMYDARSHRSRVREIVYKLSSKQ